MDMATIFSDLRLARVPFSPPSFPRFLIISNTTLLIRRSVLQRDQFVESGQETPDRRIERQKLRSTLLGGRSAQTCSVGHTILSKVNNVSPTVKIVDMVPNLCQYCLDLLALSVGQRLCINFSVSRANFLTTFVFTLGRYLFLLFWVKFI